MTSNTLAIQHMNVTEALAQPLISLVFMATFSEEFPDLILCVVGSPPTSTNCSQTPARCPRIQLNSDTVYL